MTKQRTGKDNAYLFVQTAEELAKTEIYSFCLYVGTWPWMKNKAWRKLVLGKIKESPLILKASFSPPDGYDDWVFHATLSASHDKRSLSDPE